MSLSTKTRLCGRERVNRMFEHTDHDRIPRHDSFWGETITRWQNEGFQGNYGTALELLGSDFQQLCWSWPAPFPGQRIVVCEDAQTQVIEDAFGATARFWKGRSGTPEHIGFECDNPDIWYERFKPALISTPVQVNVFDAELKFEEGRRAGKWTYLSGVESFEATRKLLGDEISLMAFAEDPEWILDISRAHTDTVLRDFDAILATGIQPDGVWIYGDMAYKNATMCSPQMYCELIWPDHKRMADWAHEHGMKFIYHTDGDINRVLDLYLDAGFDCLHPLEAKASMDVRKLAPKYGADFAFFGNIDVMLMASNDRERLEQEISTKFAAGMENKGYAYHSDHSVPPSTSWETYQFILQLIEKYGYYD